MRAFFGLFLSPFLVTGSWRRKDRLHWEGAGHAMHAIALLFGLPCGLIAAWLLLRR